MSYLETSVFGGSVFLWPSSFGELRFDCERTCLGRSTTTQDRSVRTSKPHSLVCRITRPQYSTRAIQNGANALAEGFLFSVAAGLIIAETYRTSRSNTKRREDVDDRIEDLEERLVKAHAMIRRLEEKVRSVEEQEDIESAKCVVPLRSRFTAHLWDSRGATVCAQERGDITGPVEDRRHRPAWRLGGV